MKKYWQEKNYKDKAKIRYEVNKESILDKARSKRSNETKAQRDLRLSKAKERYEKNKEARLIYQKKYNAQRKQEHEILKAKIKKLETQLQNKNGKHKNKDV